MGVWVGPGVCGGWLYSMDEAGGGGAPLVDVSVYETILVDVGSTRGTHPTKKPETADPLSYIAVGGICFANIITNPYYHLKYTSSTPTYFNLSF